MSDTAAAADGPKLKKWAKFNWEDPLLVDDQLTNQQYAHNHQRACQGLP